MRVVVVVGEWLGVGWECRWRAVAVDWLPAAVVICSNACLELRWADDVNQSAAATYTANHPDAWVRVCRRGERRLGAAGTGMWCGGVVKSAAG